MPTHGLSSNRADFDPTPSEAAHRDQVLDAVRAAIAEGSTLRLDRSSDAPFAGQVGGYGYLFEGEDDLLHLEIRRLDGGDLTIDETQAAAIYLLPQVPPALITLRPGRRAHHYYLGHDWLLMP